MFRLTPVEMILFLLAVVASLYFGYRGFKKVYLIIKRSQGEPPIKEIPGRLWNAAVNWIGLLPTWRARPVSTLLHAFIAWAFMFYFLVNALDVLKGFTGWTVPGTVGDIYRLIADVLSVAALVAMTYFLLRRFVFKSHVLNYNSNIMLTEQVKNGRIRRDSLIVGLFILCHIGFRFLGESFCRSLRTALIRGSPLRRSSATCGPA